MDNIKLFKTEILCLFVGSYVFLLRKNKYFFAISHLYLFGSYNIYFLKYIFLLLNN